MSFDLPGLPGGWTYSPLEQCAVPGSISYGVVQPGSPVSSGVSFIRVNNFGDSRLDLSDVMHISPKVEAKYSRTRLTGGEVLLTLVGSVGRVAEVPKECAGFNVARAVGVIKPANGIDAKWIAICLRSPLSQHLLGSRANTTVQTTINLKDVRALPIPIPPAAERTLISDFITALDDRIALLRETNATLEAIAQALFKSWFVDFDPVRAKSQGLAPAGMDEATAALFPGGFEESVIGLVPGGWKPVSIYALATYINGAAYKSFEPNSARQGRPIIKIAELKAGVTSQTAFSSVEMPDKYLIRTGDILFAWSGNPDTSIDTFVWTFEPAWLNQHIFRVLPRSREERAYLLELLRHLRPTFAELARNKQTTGLGHVTVSDLKSLLVAVPNQAVIDAFNACVRPMQEAIFFNRLQAQTLAEVRDTLLPRLISGQLRLPEAEQAIAAAP